jgi:hypothetical protein
MRTKRAVNLTAYDESCSPRFKMVFVWHTQDLLHVFVYLYVLQEGISSFMNRVEDIARKKLDSDQRLQYMPPETVHRELQQELDRSVYTGVVAHGNLQFFIVKVPDC